MSVEISDDYMRNRLTKARSYPVLLLKAGPNYQPQDKRTPEQARIIWEHGRRNMQLSAEGIMSLVGPLGGAMPLVGLCIFTVPAADIPPIMDADPAVAAGLFVYEIVTLFGFPGDGLPAV